MHSVSPGASPVRPRCCTEQVNLERRVISLRRGDVCCHCGKDLPSGFRAAWEPYARTITCLDCAGQDVIVNVHMPAGPGPRARRERD